MIGDFRHDGDAERYFGLHPALVTDIVDPDKLGRIEVQFPSLGGAGDSVRAWATLLTPYADDDQGFQVLPAVGTQVVVGFEAGNCRRPYIVGSAWNGKEAMPDPPAAANNKRLIKTRAGSLLEFDDTDGAAKVTLSMKIGHSLVLDEAAQTVTLRNSTGSQIHFDLSGSITITALATVTINAPAGLTVTAPSATFSGAVTCLTLTTTSVTSPLYSQGAGNIW